ncbi:ABC transporter permease [Frankia sp. QA3]|uniref:ABC transporter permease n=1 Tax=Frankia sp. QA3 TaxID=710111 RepID=UPI000269BB6A|nr:ABC transporter permease [Frankia sp. QA3]EIV92625.1 ABC-type dipeptide/oligopeptide/nickel transport system, permease component [Frankia sp. QA3]
MSGRRIALRLTRFGATFLLVTFTTTLMLELTPGSPAVFMAGDNTAPEVIQAINTKYHFDDPIPVRYGRWLAGVLHGDLGASYLTGQPVLAAIRQRLPVTVELAVLATVVALAIAVPLAVATAQRAGSRFDRVVAALASSAISLPSFVIAMLFVYLFAYRLRMFPILGWTPLDDDPFRNLRGVVLPVFSVALAEGIILLRVLRSELIETLRQDFIALARSKGLPHRTVLWKHALRPSSLSLLTLSALTLARLLGGTVIVESIFVLPGLGTLLLDAITNKDLVVVQGVVAFIAVVVLTVNFCADLLHGVLDPRTRTGR